MKKKIALFFALSLAALQLMAQGNFKYTAESHDFGTVEEGIQAAYNFEFVNTGDLPIIITNVQASCGCTTPEWPKEPIAPKGKGVIKASYNSQGRPGAFNKSITVTSNAVEPTKVLFIKGVVVPKPATPPTAEELKASPVLKLDKAAHNFGKVEINQTVKYKVKVQNKGGSDLKITTAQAGCYCVSSVLTPEVIKPGESGTLELSYTPRIKGATSDVATLSSNDITQSPIKVTLSANVVETLAPANMLKEENKAVPFK